MLNQIKELIWRLWARRAINDRRLEHLLWQLVGTIHRAPTCVLSPPAEGRLLLPTPHAGLVPERTEISFMAMDAPNGDPAMVLFTSDKALRKWRAVGCTVTIRARSRVAPDGNRRGK